MFSRGAGQRPRQWVGVASRGSNRKLLLYLRFWPPPPFPRTGAVETSLPAPSSHKKGGPDGSKLALRNYQNAGLSLIHVGFSSGLGHTSIVRLTVIPRALCSQTKRDPRHVRATESPARKC